MDFESIKEQLIERFNVIKTTVEDNETFIKLKEKYDTLSPNAQVGVKVGSILLVIYFFYSIPAGYVSSASEKLAYFEDNRALTRDLIRAGRLAKNLKTPPPAMSPSMLTSQIDTMMTQEQILPEQKKSVTPMSQVASNKMVPKGIEQSGVKASFTQLNIRQMVKLGESMQEMSGSHLINLAIQADSKDPHFFDVDYEVASFSVPQSAPLPTDDKGKKKSKFKKSEKK